MWGEELLGRQAQDRAEWKSRDRNLYGHGYTNTRAFIHTVGCAGTPASLSVHPPAIHDDHTCVPTTVHNTDCPAPHNFPSYTSHRQRGCAQVSKRGCQKKPDRLGAPCREIEDMPERETGTGNIHGYMAEEGGRWDTKPPRSPHPNYIRGRQRPGGGGGSTIDSLAAG